MRMLAASLVAIAMLLAAVVPTGGAALPAVSLLGAADFPDGNHGWIELSSSAFYSQTCQTALRQPAGCNRAVTDLFQTGDGGRTWNRRLRLTGSPLVPAQNLPGAWMHAFSSDTVLVLPFLDAPSSTPRLYRTVDGGRSWSSAPTPRSPADMTSTDVASVGPDRLWLLRHDGAAMGSEQVTVFTSGNGGARWTETACTPVPAAARDCRRPSGIQLGGHKNNIVFASAAHGWITESDASGIPSLYVTTDGGYHWVRTRPGLPRGVPRPGASLQPYADYQQPIAFGSFVILPASVIICTSTTGSSTSCRTRLYALLSLDGGRTWTGSREIPSLTSNSTTSPWQVMSPRVWWSAAGSRLWVTGDAGLHWRPIPLRLPAGFTLLQIQFVSSTTGWAIAGQVSTNASYAQHTMLLRTLDEGHTWTRVPLPVAA